MRLCMVAASLDGVVPPKGLDDFTAAVVASVPQGNQLRRSAVKLDIPINDGADDGVVSAPNNQAEARATFKTLTPDVPFGEDPSADTVGRYYDAHALNAKDKPDLLVSWSDGPVESGVLTAAGVKANFGVSERIRLHSSPGAASPPRRS